MNVDEFFDSKYLTAAESAAESAEYKWMAKTLLKLLKEAK